MLRLGLLAVLLASSFLLVPGAETAPAAGSAPAQAVPADAAAAKKCRKPKKRFLRRLSPARRRASLRRYRRCLAAQRRAQAPRPGEMVPGPTLPAPGSGPAPAPGTAPATGLRWERVEVSDAPSGRRDHVVAAVGETLYLFGGRRSGTTLADLWRLDLAAAKWTRLEPPGSAPPARFGHNLVAEPGGSLLMFGGQSGSGFLNDLWRYDPAANMWSQLDTPAAPRRYGAAGALDPDTGRLLVSHGFTDSGRFDDTWSFGAPPAVDLSGTNERPLRRCLVSGAAFGGGFFLFGGQSNADAYMDDLWRLDLAARTWTRLTPATRPSERNLYGSAQSGGSWFIHGGSTPNGSVGDLWRLDLASGAFTEVAPGGERPSARSSHAGAGVPGGIVLVGGSTSAGEASDTWRLRGL